MIITQTPLRISFAGGGTDFRDYYQKNGGAVLSTTIDKNVFVIVKKRFDKKIRVGYSITEMVDNLDELKHELVRESLRKTRLTEGIEISTMADIPSAGSGLGSSSTVTVGLLNAFYIYQGTSQTAETLAREACKIEIDVLGKPIGKQDQYAAAYGGFNIIRFMPDETVKIEPLMIDESIKRKLERNFILFYTGMARESSEVLSEQKKNIPDIMDILDELKSMVDQLKDCLSKEYLDDVGRILHQGWQCKKKIASKISNEKINELYEKALDAGALGGKITGAGGGGFMLLYSPQDKQDKVRDALKELQELPFSFNRDGSIVIFNIRR